MFFNHTNFNFRHGLFLLALLGAMLGYFLLADSNSEQILLISLQHPGIDKLAHYFLHMGIVFMVYFFSRRLQRHVNQYRLLLMAFILSQILGLVDELQQLLIANRDFDAQDLLANLLGAGSACILLLSYIRRKAWMIAALLPLLIGIGYLYQHSNTSELHYKAGLLFIKQENHIRAREAFLNAIKQGQHFPALYNELAWLELEHLNIDPAIALQHSRQAIRQEPGNADYLD
ncbi:MAG: hypothetical protein EP315_01350, partial [Gammaproteobacteria bacterium]